MRWKDPNQELPASGQYVLTLKTYYVEEGETEPWYFIDYGIHRSNGAFTWNRGGIVKYWMKLPRQPKGITNLVDSGSKLVEE